MRVQHPVAFNNGRRMKGRNYDFLIITNASSEKCMKKHLRRFKSLVDLTLS